MRIRPLLFLLAPILLGGAKPVHAALGIEPQRLPPAATQGAIDTVDSKMPIPELRQTVSNNDPEARDYLTRTIAFEASGEPEEGKAAVAHVILNRMRSGKWGDNIKDVVTRRWQFEPWTTRRTEMEKLSPDDPRYQDAARIAEAVLTGQMPDPTAGATHFLNPTIVRQRRGGSLPSWARGEGQPIGRHTFYSANEGNAGPKRPALFMSASGGPLRFDTSSQPLTRADCGKAGMPWNEGANVCTESTSTAELSLNLFPALKAPKVRVSPAKVAAPPIPAKPKTAKSPTPTRPNVAAAKASSKSKHVKSGGSRGRAVAARSSTKSSVKTASKSSVKSAAKSSVRTASKSSVKSPSKSSVKTAAKGRSTHGRVATASKRSARARIAAASAANPHWAYQLQSSYPKNRLQR
jgi:Cell Wall Hydrolase